MAKAKVKYNINCDGHFFCSSVTTWRTGLDVEDLIGKMKLEGFPFVVIWVPLPKEASYKISGFVPDVEGCVKLAEYLNE